VPRLPRSITSRARFGKLLALLTTGPVFALTGGDAGLVALVIVFAITAVIFAARWLVAGRLRCPSCGHSHIAMRLQRTGVPRFDCRRCRFEW
jgi:hypothetical protein